MEGRLNLSETAKVNDDTSFKVKITAHEFGHMLSLGHVCEGSNHQSIMREKFPLPNVLQLDIDAINARAGVRFWAID